MSQRLCLPAKKKAARSVSEHRRPDCLHWLTSGSAQGSSSQLPPRQALEMSRKRTDSKDHSRKTNQIKWCLRGTEQLSLLFSRTTQVQAPLATQLVVLPGFLFASELCQLWLESKEECSKNSQNDAAKSDMGCHACMTRKEKRNW